MKNNNSLIGPIFLMTVYISIFGIICYTVYTYWYIVLIIGIIILTIFLLIKYIIPKIIEYIKIKKYTKKQINQHEYIKSKNDNKNLNQNQQIYVNNIEEAEKFFNYGKTEKQYNYNTNKNLNKTQNKSSEKEFYQEQLNKCTKCEKVYYKTLYKKYSKDYTIKSQIYLRSMFPKMGAENLLIDLVFFDKKTNKPTLLIEINDKTHKDLLRKSRDNELREFCYKHNIKLQFLYTTFGCVPEKIYRIIDKKLGE